MKFLWRILGTAYVVLIFGRREWMWIAQSLVYTVGLMIIYTVWGGIGALKHMLIVFIVIGGWNIGLNMVAQFIGWDRVSGEYEKRIASPLTLIEYVAGVVLGSLATFGLINIFIVIFVSIYYGMDLAGLLIVFGLSIIAIFLGLFLALSIILRIRNPMNIGAVTNPLQALTTILPPVYYPATILPEPLKTFCLAIPTSTLVDLGRAVTNQAHAYPIEYSVISTILWITVVTILVMKKLKWGLE